MPSRSVLASLFTISLGFSQNLLTDFVFRGSAIDSARGVTVDSSGNIYVVGSTSSSDFPVLNAFQNVNSGTQVVYSADEGVTWKPLSSPFPNANPIQSLTGVVDPKDSSTLYVASGKTVCKSTDGGHNFSCVTLALTSARTSISSLAIDPQQPSTIYASATPFGGVFKSIDGGQSWRNASTGLPSNGYVDSVTIDPFHANVLYAWTYNAGYVSQDGSGSWTPSSLPYPANASPPGSSGVHFSFDPITSGVIYGPGQGPTVQKSSDGGRTWTKLNTPFGGCCVTPDPKISGRLYALAYQPVSANVDFWSSVDGGLTWTSSYISNGAIDPSSLAIDPSNPQILIAGAFRTKDGGKTWSPTNASRRMQAVFAPSGTVYGIARIASDAFVAKFLPDGQTLAFATYFGGMGNESANSIALDAAGNIWIAGTTSSYDLPVTPDAFQSTLKGATNGFIAKFTNDGNLLAASYLGGSNLDAIFGIAISPQGNPWLIGSSSSTDFPYTAGTPSPQYATTGVLCELDSSAQLLYSTPVDGSFDDNGKGIAIDPSGNITITGTTGDPKFPVTPGAFHSGDPEFPDQFRAKTFVSKVDPSGKPIYSTFFGGLHADRYVSRGERDYGVSVATDGEGNAYVAGYTSANDFPTTSGSYQASMGHFCPFYTFSYNTGVFGTELTLFVDDSFVVKLSPNGKAIYATLLGGGCYDHPTSIAVDASGNAYISGETDSVDYPLVFPIEGAPRYRQFESFVSVLNPGGSALTFSTYLQAGSTPSVTAASNGSIYIAGSTGIGAQSKPDSAFDNPFPLITTNAYLATIHATSNAPAVSVVQVSNAFSQTPGAVAPGEIITLSVSGFAPAQWADVGLNALAPLTTNLQGVQVFFDGRPAFVMSVSFEKIECIAPVEIAGQNISRVQVSIAGALSNVFIVNVALASLGLLSADGSGTGLANARNSDGTLNSETNPALPGSTVTVFVTGVGVTNPPEEDGVIPSTSNIVPVATISSDLIPSTGSIHALAGFVPGIFSYAIRLPNTPQLQLTLLGIALRTDSSQSQQLGIYAR